MWPAESCVEAVRQVLDILLGMERARLEELKETSFGTYLSTFNPSKTIDEFERWLRAEVIGG